jgi:hypothetical protein
MGLRSCVSIVVVVVGVAGQTVTVVLGEDVSVPAVSRVEVVLADQ